MIDWKQEIKWRRASKEHRHNQPIIEFDLISWTHKFDSEKNDHKNNGY